MQSSSSNLKIWDDLWIYLCRKLSHFILMKKNYLLLPFLTLAFVAESQNISDTSSQYQFRVAAELGFVSVLSHQIQLSKNGTNFDYVKSGGQDVLFPVGRFSVEMQVRNRHTFILLYQPLGIESKILLKKDATFDNTTFAEGTAMKCLYNFPFYRLSYLRELFPSNKKYQLGLGATVQIRNATITFESLDGTRFISSQGVGIVPALKIRGRMKLNRILYTELEADGIYAPVSYLNGSDNEIVGAILDASVRVGANITPHNNLFLNVRYLGGGATGTDPDDPGPGDGYVKNWLHFMLVSTGFVYQF